jgi:hypothetical protein
MCVTFLEIINVSEEPAAFIFNWKIAISWKVTVDSSEMTDKYLS